MLNAPFTIIAPLPVMRLFEEPVTTNFKLPLVARTSVPVLIVVLPV